MQSSRLAFISVKNSIMILLSIPLVSCFSYENPKWGNSDLQRFALQIPFTAPHREVESYLRRQGLTERGYDESSRTITAIMRETRKGNMVIIESIQFDLLFSSDDHLTELRVSRALTSP